MKKRRKLVKIKNISGVITNSSTEVYLFQVTDHFKEFFKGLEGYFKVIFLTEEDIRKYLLENDMWVIESDLDYVDVIKSNPLGNNFFLNVCEDLGKTREEIVEFCFPLYKPLLGYALLKKDDTWEWDKIREYCETGNPDVDKVYYEHS